MKLERKLTSEEIRIVHSHYSVSADVLLARWWKVTSLLVTEDYISTLDEESIVSVIKSNAGPQTQLYHISR